MTPNGWRALRLGDAVSFEYGRSLPSAQRRGGPVPVCGSNGVVGYHDESLVRGPGIVVGRKGSVGAVAWMGCDFWPIDTTYYVNPSSQTDARWLYYAMSNLGLERLNEATGIPGLNRSTAASLHFQLPPIVEQRKIAAILSSVDDAIEKTQAVIDQVQGRQAGPDAGTADERPAWAARTVQEDGHWERFRKSGTYNRRQRSANGSSWASWSGRHSTMQRRAYPVCVPSTFEKTGSSEMSDEDISGHDSNRQAPEISVEVRRCCDGSNWVSRYIGGGSGKAGRSELR